MDDLYEAIEKRRQELEAQRVETAAVRDAANERLKHIDKQIYELPRRPIKRARKPLVTALEREAHAAEQEHEGP